MAKVNRSSVVIPGATSGAALAFRLTSLLRRAATGVACRSSFVVRPWAAIDRTRGTNRGNAASTKAAALDQASFVTTLPFTIWICAFILNIQICQLINSGADNVDSAWGTVGRCDLARGGEDTEHRRRISASKSSSPPHAVIP